MKGIRAATTTAWLAGAVLPATAWADRPLTFSFGADIGRGDYGEPVDTRSLALPVSLKYERGDLTLRAGLAHVTTEGTANPEVGAPVSDTIARQSGLGDLTVAGAYTVFTSDAGDVGIELGAKVKLPTADRRKELITTGKTDVSLHADVYKGFGAVTAFGTVGWTKKGAPAGIRFRNPFICSLGLSTRIAASTSAGASWDYRAKVTRGGDPIREATLFVTHKWSSAWKSQLYLVRGFTDATADAGGGVVLGYSF